MSFKLNLNKLNFKEECMSDEVIESQVNKTESGVNVIVSIDKEGLAQAIEKGLEKTVSDLKGSIKKHTQLFAFSALGIVAMLALIALFLSSYK